MKLLTASLEELRSRAERLAELMSDALGDACKVSVEESNGLVGGGALPELLLEGFSVMVKPNERSAERIERGLRDGTPPIVCRLDEGTLCFDVRTLFERDLVTISERMAALVVS